MFLTIVKVEHFNGQVFLKIGPLNHADSQGWSRLVSISSLIHLLLFLKDGYHNNFMLICEPQLDQTKTKGYLGKNLP